MKKFLGNLFLYFSLFFFVNSIDLFAFDRTESPLRSILEGLLQTPQSERSTLGDGTIVVSISVGKQQGGIIRSKDGKEYTFLKNKEGDFSIARNEKEISSCFVINTTCLGIISTQDDIKQQTVTYFGKSGISPFITTFPEYLNRLYGAEVALGHKNYIASLVTESEYTSWITIPYKNNLLSSDSNTQSSVFPIVSQGEKISGKDSYTDGISEQSIKVIVTEKVPGADCVPYASSTNTQNKDGTTIININNGDGTVHSTNVNMKDGVTSGVNKETNQLQNIATRKYICTIQPGFGSFQTMFAQIIRWFVFIVMLLGVLGIVLLGIAWAWAGGDDVKTKSNLKKWAINIAIGLVILFFFRYILTLIAPWIYG